MPTITEAGTAAVIEMLTAKAQARYATLSEAWPKEMKAAGDKVMGLVNDEVANFLSGDLSAVRDALVADVVKAFKTGKSPISKSLSDLA